MPKVTVFVAKDAYFCIDLEDNEPVPNMYMDMECGYFRAVRKDWSTIVFALDTAKTQEIRARKAAMDDKTTANTKPNDEAKPTNAMMKKPTKAMMKKPTQAMMKKPTQAMMKKPTKATMDPKKPKAMMKKPTKAMMKKPTTATMTKKPARSKASSTTTTTKATKPKAMKAMKSKAAMKAMKAMKK
eukprot:TRINITY_DN12491_c0_g1_i1.p2 TRINITY_DN12491_c0_g1~~TRINITY_DN12491_c0_g1_i1.p2  ORF type:complete len:185 (-),score=65.15 TRINITY_DN12491_c0_g1_i1:151-705(-)